MPKIHCQSKIKSQKNAKTFFVQKKDYEAQLLEAQKDLLSTQQAMIQNKLKLVIVLEGCDTAGKGGVIRRMAQYLDPRSFHVYGMGPPVHQEIEQHYLQRFFFRLPLFGEICVFDRSWYGRVLVERVDQLCSVDDWKRAYDEINCFEKLLTDDGVVVLKYFLDLSHAEQGRRFQERKKDPLKSWKLKDSDLKSRKKWDSYQIAFRDMLKKTSTKSIPWKVIPADSKWYSRVAILQDIAKETKIFRL